MITILFTKEKYFAISQMAKEIINFIYLIKTLMLYIFKVLIVECDNMQIIKLLINKSTKL